MSKVAKALLILGGAALATVAVLQSAFAGPAVNYSQEIYKLTLTAPGAASSVPEWTSLRTGAWRADVEGQAMISTDDSYVVVDQGSGSVYHRTGSPSFMGDLHAAPEGVLALRAYLKGDQALANRGLHLAVGKDSAGKTTLGVADAAGKRAFSVTIEDRISDEDAAAAHILDATPVRPDVTDTELTVGQATPSTVKAYWFGRAVGTLHAAAASEHARARTPAQIAGGMGPRGDGTIDVTFYEQPGVQATGAQPGLLKRPDGELQVTSEAIDSAHAQGLVAAFNGANGDQTYPAWPRSTIRLADGKDAVVVPDQFDGDGPVRTGFFVIAGATLVHVSGDVAAADIPGLAAKLKPLG